MVFAGHHEKKKAVNKNTGFIIPSICIGDIRIKK
jgi:hypothetical protein